MNNDLISRNALMAELKERLRCCNHGRICEATYGAVIGLVDAQPTIDAVAKDRVIACVTGIIEGYSDAHVITCAVCGLPFPDYGADETVACSWCKAKSHSEAYAPFGPGYCKTSEDRKAKTFDKLFSAPTIDAAPVVHGHWVADGDTQTCSNCGEEHEWGDYRASYCDTCGAKMDGKETLYDEKTYKRNQSCDLVDE